jgi:hypothetical protein
MINRFLIILISALLFTTQGFAYDAALNQEPQHVEVSLRMIGHQVLLSLGDSISRVLPIENTDRGYKIAFESEFAFNPEDVAAVIDSVVAATRISNHYIVRVETCEKQFVIHSYEVAPEQKDDVLACGTREQPKRCYAIFMVMLDSPDIAATLISQVEEKSDTGILSNWPMILGGLIIVLSGVGFYAKSKKSIATNNPGIISIGAYLFNKRKMELSFKGEAIELTSKECDLLQLLCDSTNDTVERETILKMVWGDEGDYVGRTLDVFISKLRKKLEGDSNIKIANIRGVGYKLVVDV